MWYYHWLWCSDQDPRDRWVLFLVGTQVADTRSEGSNVAVFGIGCVGLSILQGAREKKCKRVFAMDTNSGKEEWARKFGASELITPIDLGPDAHINSADFVNPAELKDKSIVEYLVEQTDGGLDFTFDATGNVNVMRSALEACHKGWGVCNIIGVAPAGAEIATRP